MGFFVSLHQEILVMVELGMKKFPEARVNLGVFKSGILRISKRSRWGNFLYSFLVAALNGALFS